MVWEQTENTNFQVTRFHTFDKRWHNC